MLVVEVAGRMIDLFERLEERLTRPFDKRAPTQPSLVERICWYEEAYHSVQRDSTPVMYLNAIIEVAKETHTSRGQ